MKAIHEFLSQKEYLEYLRTYFAAMAMQKIDIDHDDALYLFTSENNIKDRASLFAHRAVILADALIKALNKAQ